MYKIGICGHFGDNTNLTNGQTIKTKTIYNKLLEKYNETDILKLDTYNWKKNPINFFWKCIKGLKKSKNFIFMPSMGGIKIFAPLLTRLNAIFNNNLIYIVIGRMVTRLCST